MRAFVILLSLLVVSFTAACDMRSETAKREMEKFSGTPTPTIAPAPEEAPIDPAEIVKVDNSVQGDMITINGFDQKKTIACTKFNRVMISGGQNVVKITGGCQQITINGDGNRITSEASLAYIFNGAKNTVTYTGFVNGKRPSIKENADGNTVEKVAADTKKK